MREDGQPGWQEKPLAYAVVKAKDASIDRLPQVSFDMHFDDQAGAVTLPILSNAPARGRLRGRAAPARS